jgi:esterase/lipase
MLMHPSSLTRLSTQLAPVPAQTCCLLVHGSTALPQEFDALAARLMSEGLACRILRLPGDEVTWHALVRSAWSDWLAALRAATWETARRFSSVVLIGHSLGAALALPVAADGTLPLAGVVALCPPLRMWPGEVTALQVIRHLMPGCPHCPMTPRPLAAGARRTWRMRWRTSRYDRL